MEPPYIHFTSNYFSIGHGTDPGATGKNNEDNYAIFEAVAQQGDDQATTRPVYVAVVADGIGGAVSGELASRLAIQYFVEKFQQEQGFSIPERLESAILYTNRAIFATALEGLSNRGMGTTIVAAAICNDELYIAHAGDSRAYLLRRGQIYQLTLDHTWVQEAIDAGYLTPEQAERHPNKNVIKRYLGPLDHVEVDHTIIALEERTGDVSLPEHRHWADDNRLALQPGDTLLLCSDGLSDVVSDATILETILRYRPPKAVTELIGLANAAGGPDNITALILQHAGTPLATRPTLTVSAPSVISQPEVPAMPRRGGGLRALLLAVLLLGLAIGAGLLLPQLLAPRSARQPGNTPGYTPEPASQPIAVITVQPATATSQPNAQRSAHTVEPTLAISPTLALTQTVILGTPTISASQSISTALLANKPINPQSADPLTQSATVSATATNWLTVTTPAQTSSITATTTLTPTTDLATPLRNPTSTAIAPTATLQTASSKRTNPNNTPIPTPSIQPTELLGAVQLDMPEGNATLGREVTFRWSMGKRASPEVNQVLTSTSPYLFELIVFPDPNHPEEGRALVQASKAHSITVNVDILQNSPWHFIEGKEYYWSVRLGKTANGHYQALALLAPPRRFVFRPTTDK